MPRGDALIEDHREAAVGAMVAISLRGEGAAPLDPIVKLVDSTKQIDRIAAAELLSFLAMDFASARDAVFGLAHAPRAHQRCTMASAVLEAHPDDLFEKVMRRLVRDQAESVVGRVSFLIEMGRLRKFIDPVREAVSAARTTRIRMWWTDALRLIRDGMVLRSWYLERGPDDLETVACSTYTLPFFRHDVYTGLQESILSVFLSMASVMKKGLLPCVRDIQAKSNQDMLTMCPGADRSQDPIDIERAFRRERAIATRVLGMVRDRGLANEIDAAYLERTEQAVAAGLDHYKPSWPRLIDLHEPPEGEYDEFFARFMAVR